MAVTIIITRTVKDNAMSAKLAPLLVQLRSRATVQPGFLTDQTFSCLDCQGEFLIMSTWNSIDDWLNWKNSDERQAIQEKIDALIGEETIFRHYEPVIGGILPSFDG